MTDSTSDHLTQLWRAGVPLSQSWQTYAHPSLKEAWETQSKVSALASLEEAATEIGKTDMPVVDKLAKVLAGPQKILGERHELKEKMRSDVLGYVRDGYLFGYGFEPPRTLASRPVEIPLKLRLSAKPRH